MHIFEHDQELWDAKDRKRSEEERKRKKKKDEERKRGGEIVDVPTD